MRIGIVLMPRHRPLGLSLICSAAAADLIADTGGAEARLRRALTPADALDMRHDTPVDRDQGSDFPGR